MITELLSYWPLFLIGLGYSLFRELSEHAKEDGFPAHWLWWNTGTAWRNKHEWGWMFEDVLVFATDAEHFFQALATLSVLAALWVSGGSLYGVAAFILGLVATGLIKKVTDLK